MRITLSLELLEPEEGQPSPSGGVSRTLACDVELQGAPGDTAVGCCGHEFDLRDILRELKTSKSGRCPLCNQEWEYAELAQRDCNPSVLAHASTFACQLPRLPAVHPRSPALMYERATHAGSPQVCKDHQDLYSRQ